MKPSIHWEHASFMKGPKPDDPPQDVDKFHPSVSSTTTTNLNDTCPLVTSYEHPLHLDSPSLSWLPPRSWGHVLKKPDTAVGEQDFSVNWFKFIQPSHKPRMTETPVQKLVNVASPPIAFMNYKWIINLHDGYHLLHILPPKEYIPPTASYPV